MLLEIIKLVITFINNLSNFLSKKHEKIEELYSVKDFENLFSKSCPKDVVAYYNCGADEERTTLENRNAFHRYILRPRMFVDVSNINLSTTIFGQKIATPIGICPMAMHTMAHRDGERATAKAIEKIGGIYIQSFHSSTSIEDLAWEVPHLRKWMQITLCKGTISIDMIKRAEKCGYEAIVVSVDTMSLGNRLELKRLKFDVPQTTRLANFDLYIQGKSEEESKHLTNYSTDLLRRDCTWNYVQYLKGQTSLPLILKGIQTKEDALLAMEYGADAIYVSNHGGRQLDSGKATIDILPEIVEAVKGRCSVFLDGGIMHGSDIFKAIALGADMVFVGRPILWGLGVAGEAGVDRVLSILKEELITTMTFCGTPDVNLITGNHCVKCPPVG